MGPLQLASAPHAALTTTKPGVAPNEAIIRVALAEGEVRPATEAELRAIAQLLPRDRDYARLADVQRAVTSNRQSGKTTKDKRRKQMRNSCEVETGALLWSQMIFDGVVTP